MTQPVISLNRDALSQFEEAIHKEWLTTNGLGGYASSTVLGVNTRKYHGLLVAAFHPPGDRHVCLAKLDEELEVGSSTYRLGANEFQTGIFPKGFLMLKEFALAPFPRFAYATENLEVRKVVFMPHEHNAVVVLYKILNRSEVDTKVRVFPLVNWRHFHSVTDRWRDQTDITHRESTQQLEITTNNPKSTLMIESTSGEYHFEDKWIERMYYREEAARGESCFDDCYQAGFFEVPVGVERSESFSLVATAGCDEAASRAIMAEIPANNYDLEALYEKEVARREKFLSQFYESHRSIPTSDWLSWLVLASDAFVAKGSGPDERSVIAGYYWFESWGRDTFVSLPGLLLVTGRFDDARKVFLSFKKHCRNGLIPNFIPEPEGEPAYNSVDATLWYVNAVLQYLKYTDDFKFVREQLWDMLKAIVGNLVTGTLFGVRVDADGLLVHGGQLTWMDATVDGRPVTPRAGKAVEVQALWFNTLKTMELLAHKYNEDSVAIRYASMAERAKISFVEKFWNIEKACLFDVVGEDWHDGSLRPNQIMAVSLDFGMLDEAKNESVVDVVQREFLTPFGLRTLARSDSRYMGVYAGDRRIRDLAYHNGTVWAWLLGPFTTAYLKAKGYTEFRREQALDNILTAILSKQMFEAGLGSVSEIFDGEPPHTARGCIAQAWSTAEPLRAYMEDVARVEPKHQKDLLNLS